MATTPLTIELDTDKVTAEIRAYIDSKLAALEAEVERMRAETDELRERTEAAEVERDLTIDSLEAIRYYRDQLVAEVERLRAEGKRQQQWKADVLREAAHEIESRYPADVWLPDSPSPDAQAARGVRVACKQLRHMADEAEADQ